jgi:putative transposase
MDEAHLAAAARHVAMNPAPARLVSQAQDWPWSRVRAHSSGEADGLTWLDPARDRFADFADRLDDTGLDALQTPLRQGETIGRPPGAAAFLDAREAQPGRRLHPNRPARKPKALDAAGE